MSDLVTSVPKDLLDILATYDVIETFKRLPVADQERFVRWIDMATDDESMWIRIEAFVLALRWGPLEAENPEGSAGPAEGVG